MERVESLKAGIVGAIAIGFATLLIRAVTPLLPMNWGAEFHWPMQMVGLSLAGVAHGAIALFTGFLFGVAYRYLVRQDTNPHLQTGAVMAFGLIRGLAQIAPQLNLLDHAIGLVPWLAWGMVLVQNVALFAIAQPMLQQALNRGWVRPLGSLSH